MGLKRYDLHSDWTGATMKEHPTGDYVEFDDVEHLLLGHDQYKTGDADAPDEIKDANGEVVLAMCKRCEGAEAELDAPCAERLAKQVEELVHKLIDRDMLIDELRPYLTHVIDEMELEYDYEHPQTEAQRRLVQRANAAKDLSLRVLKVVPDPVAPRSPAVDGDGLCGYTCGCKVHPDLAEATCPTHGFATIELLPPESGVPQTEQFPGK